MIPTQLSLTDRAYHLIEEMIVTLELAPGSVFSEAELSQKLAIGRTPIREALLKLANDQLVTSIPRRGMVVSEINIKDHLSLLDTRRVLDELLARQAAKRATVQQRSELDEIAHKMDVAEKTSNLQDFVHIDALMDDVIAAASRNSYASKSVMPLHAHCRRFWYYFKRNDDFSETARRHITLIDAIVAEKPDEAAAASNRLLDFLEEFTRSALDL